MTFVNTIVDYINDQLKGEALNRLQPVKYYNIASTISRTDQPGMFFPGMMNISGEVLQVSPDDLYNVTIYHKIISNTYGRKTKGSTADNIDVLCTSEMQMFVFAQSDKIKMTAEKLEPYIVFSIPEKISRELRMELQLKDCSIRVLSADMDKIRNFKNEYQNVRNFLSPEHIFFSIRYNIIETITRSCIDLCAQC